MNGSLQVRDLSRSWLHNWKQAALLDLGEKLGPNFDEREYEHDEASDFVRRFFHFNLLRRLDGPDKKGKNAVLRHLKRLAAKEGLDLGQVELE